MANKVSTLKFYQFFYNKEFFQKLFGQVTKIWKVWNYIIFLPSRNSSFTLCTVLLLSLCLVTKSITKLKLNSCCRNIPKIMSCDSITCLCYKAGPETRDQLINPTIRTDYSLLGVTSKEQPRGRRPLRLQLY